MKISELVKQLSKVKRLHGDILIGYDGSTVDESLDSSECVVGIDVFGVYQVRFSDEYPARNKRMLILGDGGNDSVFTGPEVKPRKIKK